MPIYTENQYTGNLPGLKSTATRTYVVVKKGDTVGAIAKRLAAEYADPQPDGERKRLQARIVAEIVRLNRGMKADAVVAGQQLLVPDGSSRTLDRLGIGG
jgi:LysM repeat protein